MSALGKPVEIAEIESALHALWEEDDAATRASLTNFAIYSECDDCLETNTDLIGRITREHACRAILIASRPDAPERQVKAWVTAHCQLSGGKKSVCSEQVTFDLGQPSASLIRNIVFAHLDSDLPLVLWWQGGFTPVFDDRLYSLIDRLLIDSSAWENPSDEFATLVTARDDPSSRFVLYDLTWARLLPYRLATAGMFDHPAAAAALGDVTAIHVSHAPGERTLAAFLLAWLTTREGWDASGCACSIGEDPLGETKICFTAKGGMLSVTPTSDAGFLKSTLALGGCSAEQIYPAGPTDPASLVARQLQSGGAPAHYFGVLVPAALELLAG
jgi:glucose-6-phosphate dehydrogenase assembly protein OpcA